MRRRGKGWNPRAAEEAELARDFSDRHRAAGKSAAEVIVEIEKTIEIYRPHQNQAGYVAALVAERDRLRRRVRP